MAMNFPSSPTTGQQYSVSGGPTYTWDGTVWKILTPGSQFSEQAFTATAGQTTFTISGGYVIGAIDVFRNGVKLVSGSDYTATDLATVVLVNACSAGDTVEVIKLAQILYTDALKKTGDTMTGNLSFAQNSTISANTGFTLALNGGGGSNGLVLDASNNVGIGTSSISTGRAAIWGDGNGAATSATNINSQLHIVTTNSAVNANNAARITFNAGNSTAASAKIEALRDGNDTFQIINNYAGPLILGTNGTGKATLDSSGNLGLGVTPKTAWQTGAKVFQFGARGFLNSNANGSYCNFGNNAYFDGTDWRYLVAAGATIFQSFEYGFTWNIASSGAAGATFVPTQAMTLDASGNLLVGNTVNDSSRLSVEATTVGYAIRFRRNTTTYGTSAIVGSIACDGSSTVYNTSSDQRLKTNITSSGSAAQSILDFPVDQFDWISDGSHVDFGAVAQKAINVIPEMVSVPEDPEEMWGIDWSKAVPRLIRAYQELHTEIESLKARIN